LRGLIFIVFLFIVIINVFKKINEGSDRSSGTYYRSYERYIEDDRGNRTEDKRGNVTEFNRGSLADVKKAPQDERTRWYGSTNTSSRHGIQLLPDRGDGGAGLQDGNGVLVSFEPNFSAPEDYFGDIADPAGMDFGGNIGEDSVKEYFMTDVKAFELTDVTVDSGIKLDAVMPSVDTAGMIGVADGSAD